MRGTWMKRALVGAVIGAWLAGSAVALASIDQVERREDGSVVVPCATEDSCAVDYRDGAWHITPTVP